ncbi:MAG TPA: hypothetical protein VE779_09100 [Candidatus Angelobacter sp.]|nr:hypothetical protein [Candidatus Angelobacter sp.]
MKRFMSLLILSAAVAVTAFAVDGGSKSVHFDNPVKVGSTELPAGDYKVTWTGSGDHAQVTLKQGKNVVTTTAQVVDVRHNNDAVATKSDNGSRVLTQIQFQDKTLVLNNAPSQVAGR